MGQRRLEKQGDGKKVVGRPRKKSQDCDEEGGDLRKINSSEQVMPTNLQRLVSGLFNDAPSPKGKLPRMACSGLGSTSGAKMPGSGKK